MHLPVYQMIKEIYLTEADKQLKNYGNVKGIQKFRDERQCT
jgi:hypothetical protein